MAENKDEKWYTWGICSLIVGALTYYAFVDYDEFIRPDHTSSGKGSKLMALILAGIDKLGGKWLVLVLLLSVVVVLLYWTVKGLMENKR